MSSSDPAATARQAAEALQRRRRAATQQQFLEVVDADEARRRFAAALRPAPLGPETVPLAAALHRILAADVVAGVDVPNFDRANVDGFAVRAADTAGAGEEAPCRLRLNPEVLTPGVEAVCTVEPGTATVLATGAVIPRGADAVVMVEDTELADDGELLLIRRPTATGAFVTFAGTDVGRGETVLHAGQVLTSREVGLLAAVGQPEAVVYRRPRVAVISTGDEVVAPGEPLGRGRVYDSNEAIVAAAVEELGCEAVRLGAVADDPVAMEAMVRRGLACDMVILSGGTSKGAGDLSYHVISGLGAPGIVVHGVAIKPGKPLCLAVADGKPLVILPGFPTSAIFTFHEFVAPVLLQMAGSRERRRAGVEARLAVRTRSESGRTEYLMVNLLRTAGGYAAYPTGKNSGAVTTFSKADGFMVIPAQTEQLAADTPVEVQLISERLEPADLVTIGSHCVGLDRLLGRLQGEGLVIKSLHVGSMGGLAAARRGECDIAGVHLMDPDTQEYNRPFLEPGMELVKGYRRLQGVVFRAGDARFAAAATPEEGVAAALADPRCIMVNRNAGSGTRVLIDRLLGDRQPAGYGVQTNSHNAVASAVAQGRADWGVAIDTVAREYGLDFLPLKEEHYDFVIPESRLERPAVGRFLALLHSEEGRALLAALGFRHGGEAANAGPA
ncbi:MAG: molybdopterin biosynthesis protein [Gammaproteobacteria bacterium]|nr:molybdopterin biosynthesis protein [Gammaproteobacteria bacterium]